LTTASLAPPCSGPYSAEAAAAQDAGTGWLGVQLKDLTKEEADALGWEAPRGAKLVRPVPGGPAEAAGLKPDDVFVSLDGAEIEIWQCDAFGSYRHPRGAGDRIDAGFQGFGATRSDGRGGYRFRTIRPVPYPGRTPHIHVKLRHPSFGEVTSQLFVVGEPGNPGDFLYRSLDEGDRQEVDMRLQRAPAGDAVMWIAERDLVVGA